MPMPDLEPALMLAILEKMGEQLQGVIDVIEMSHAMPVAVRDRNMRDALAQQATLKWAHSCCVAQHPELVA